MVLMPMVCFLLQKYAKSQIRTRLTSCWFSTKINKVVRCLLLGICVGFVYFILDIIVSNSLGFPSMLNSFFNILLRIAVMLA